MKNHKAFAVALFFFANFFINACNPTLVPLKGQYVTSSKEIVTTLSTDSIWTNIEHLFNMYGLPVKKVDTTNGIITTHTTAFSPLYTFENETGKLQEPQAWVAIPRAILKKKQWDPKSIYSQWHIQFFALGNGRTSIKVDSAVICTYFANSFVQMETHGQSTGKLEEILRSTLVSKL